MGSSIMAVSTSRASIVVAMSSPYLSFMSCGVMLFCL